MIYINHHYYLVMQKLVVANFLILRHLQFYTNDTMSYSDLLLLVKYVPIACMLTQSESFSCSGDAMVDTNIGAWVGELHDCFMGINSMDSAASDDVQHLDGYILENQLQFVPTSFQKGCLEQNYTTQETLQNIASFQVCLSGLSSKGDFSCSIRRCSVPSIMNLRFYFFRKRNCTKPILWSNEGAVADCPSAMHIPAPRQGAGSFGYVGWHCRLIIHPPHCRSKSPSPAENWSVASLRSTRGHHLHSQASLKCVGGLVHHCELKWGFRTPLPP
jgi:hypothetical protein